MRPSPRQQSAAALALAAVLLGGCEQLSTTGVVSGKVTIDGTEAKSGSIAFFPIDGQTATSGAVIADGRYEAKAPFGAMRVEIRVPKVIGQEKLYDTADSPVREKTVEALPARYNDQSELQVEIKPDQLEHNFELKTK
jgi:hypothetical protein